MNDSHIPVFLSYHTNDKDTALLLKNESYPTLNCFLAPDDIVAGINFRQVLYEEITSREIFIALISKDYTTSTYSDQELGIALGLKKYVIPFCIDDTLPYGFLDGMQCICSKDVCVEKKIPELVNSIFAITNPGIKYVDLCINKIRRSSTWADASYWVHKIEDVSQFTKDQLHDMTDALLLNDQVSNSWGARPILTRILEYNRRLLSDDDRDRLMDFNV